MPAAARVHFAAHKDAGYVILAALLAILPLLLRGTSCGHDLSFHLLNWFEAATQWTHGTLRPFWAFHGAWNAGEPRFVFYPPASWALGALLGLVLPWAAAPAVYTFVALLLCGLGMRHLLRHFVPPSVAAAGACLYIANPYMLFVAYERTAYAELLAAAWMPLLLLAVLRNRIEPTKLSVVVALLWLTNAPAAVVASYSLLVLGTARLLRTFLHGGAAKTTREAAQIVSAYLLGLALASFFLVPAIVQRRFVQIDMAILPGLRPADSFTFHHSGDPGHDAVLRSASWIAVAVLAVALPSLAALFLSRPLHHAYTSMKDRATAQYNRTERSQAIAALGALSVVVLFLLTRWSAPVWSHAPDLAFLQFPWRFLSIEAAAAVFLLTLLLSFKTSAKSRTVLLPAALIFATLAPWAADRLYRQPCDDEDTPAAQRAIYTADTGTEPTDEYTPKTADNDVLKSNLPAAWLTTTDDGAPEPASLPGIVSVSDDNPAHLHFSIRASARDRMFVVRLRQFPGWVLTLDGKPRTDLPSRNDGLFSIALAAGNPHEIDLHYRWTHDEIAGTAVSIAALVLLASLRKRETAPPRANIRAQPIRAT